MARQEYNPETGEMETVYDDEDQGGATYAPSNISPAQTAAERAAAINAGVVSPAYQELLGRAPTAAELAADNEMYERYGGEALRAELARRRGPVGGNEPPVLTSGGDSWFDGLESGGVGPEPFPETYTTPPRPDYLQGEYKPPVWSEVFKAPTMDDVMADPGYGTRLSAGVKARDASAAAQGSVLSGGHQKKLERYGQEYGANEYANTYGRRYGEYQQRYGEFQNSANMGLQARGLNENAYQSDVGNNLNQYLSRFNAYQAAIGNTRNATNDYWNRNQDLAQNSLQALALGRPPV